VTAGKEDVNEMWIAVDKAGFVTLPKIRLGILSPNSQP
jgi:hypothetical protein